MSRYKKLGTIVGLVIVSLFLLGSTSISGDYTYMGGWSFDPAAISWPDPGGYYPYVGGWFPESAAVPWPNPVYAYSYVGGWSPDLFAMSWPDPGGYHAYVSGWSPDSIYPASDDGEFAYYLTCINGVCGYVAWGWSPPEPEPYEANWYYNSDAISHYPDWLLHPDPQFPAELIWQ
jgi:hypothetical protein